MKKLIVAAAAMALMVLSGTAFAATTATPGFNVNMTLTPICAVTTAPQPLSMTYLPFTTNNATTASTSVEFSCSFGLAPTGITFTNTTGDATVNNASATAPTAAGVLNGVAYTLKTAGFATTPSTAGTAATASAAATANKWAVTVTADAAANQAGQGSTSTSSTASHVYTLTIAY